MAENDFWATSTTFAFAMGLSPKDIFNVESLRSELIKMKKFKVKIEFSTILIIYGLGNFSFCAKVW